MLLKKILNFSIYKQQVLLKTHKNFTQVYFDKKNNFFRKTIKNNSGIENLISEKEGLIWYCRLLKKNSKKIIKGFNFKSKKPYIDLKRVKGVQIKSWRTLEENYPYVLRTFHHYKKFFPKYRMSKIHGDLTLDNIIFGNKKVFIIDWEYFRSKKNHNGYDIAYFLLSTLCLPYIAKKKIFEKDEKLFIQLWKRLHEMKINKKILYDPFSFFENNIKNDFFLKKAFKISKSKFFPFITDKRYKKRVLSIIRNL